MASTKLSSWGTWQQTRNTLVKSLGMNIAARNAVSAGTPDFDQLTKNIDQTLKDMGMHATNGLKIIDLAIADSGLLGQIEAASKEARSEASRIKEATAKVNELTELVAKVSKPVRFLAQL